MCTNLFKEKQITFSKVFANFELSDLSNIKVQKGMIGLKRPQLRGIL